jgi:hypothetical protein
VVAYYWLKSAASTPLKLELLDDSGAVHTCAASDTPVRPVDTEALNVQAIWQQPAQPPSAAAGMHRFALGGSAGRGGGGGGGGFGGRGGRGGGAPPVPDACTGAVAVAAAPAGGRGRGRGRGPAGGLQPGQYSLRLTVDGKIYTQPVAVKPDPRGAPKGAVDDGGGE